MTATRTTLVTGAGGFIGGHLVRALLARGERVRAVDVAPLDRWHQRAPEARCEVRDLRLREACEAAVDGVDHVYALAADMGGMGFIETHRADCMLSVLIDAHLLQAAHAAGVGRLFYASSACVYRAGRQDDVDLPPLREDDVYPAMPEDGYGWQKLYGERLCRHVREDYGLETRVARYHNVYGPHGHYRGGREKAPAALCRKVAEAVLDGTGEVEIWGDGRQSRTFTYVDDCVEGTLRIMDGEWPEPVNVGSAERVSVDGLVDLIEEAAGVRLRRRYRPDAPQGVRGRSSDNALMRARYGWEPSTGLREGIARTYAWVREQVEAERRGGTSGAEVDGG